MQNTCYMMVGLPGSGKSTASNELLKEFPDLEIVSTDQYIEDYAAKKGKSYNEVYRELGDDAQKWMSARIQQLVKNKKSFIWDQTNVYASSRKKKIARLASNKYQVIAIVVELSPAELQKRINKRAEEGGKKIGYKVMQELIENYVRPDYAEGFVDIYLITDNSTPILLHKNEIKNKI